MRIAACALPALFAASAMAAPPPPPPEYIVAAADKLLRPGSEGSDRIAPFFAKDVVVLANGAPVATDKAAWLKWHAKDTGDYDHGRVIGYSEGWGHEPTILVMDTFDPIGSAHLPPDMISDPRMETRSTFYRFGADHLIHAVQISETNAFFIKAIP